MSKKSELNSEACDVNVAVGSGEADIKAWNFVILLFYNFRECRKEQSVLIFLQLQRPRGLHVLQGEEVKVETF